MLNIRRLSFALLAGSTLLAGCGVGTNLSSTGVDDLSAMARKAIGGAAYANFKIAPQLPTSTQQRAAVKLTYLMTDDKSHQSPWSQQMLQMMDDQPQKNVHNVIFRDGIDQGDCRMYYVQQGDKDANTVRSPQSLLAPNVSEVQSNNPQVFSQILGYTLDHYPGRRKYLELYTHGAGVFGVGCDATQTDLAGKVLPQDQQIWAMPIYDFSESLRQALKGRQLDMIYFRACLMGNVEALYELRGTTHYALASEDVSYSVANSNLTMTKMFDDLANQDADPGDIARAMAITAHAKHPGDGDDMSGYKTFAAVDITRMDELKTAINQLALALKADLPKEKAAILAAYDAVPTIQGDAEVSQYYQHMRDLWAFSAQLQQRVKDKGVQDAVTNVRAAQDAAMIHEKDTYGSASNGLSIFMPSRAKWADMAKYLSGNYQKTRFAHDSAWDEFLMAVGSAQ